MLVQRRNTEIRTYFVWGLFGPLDDEDRAREAARRYAAPGAAHFWMPAPALREDLISDLKIPGARAIFDVYLLFGKGAFWETRLPIPAYWQRQMQVLQGEPFSITGMETQIQKLLAR